jgi:hypothetical protein
VINILDSFQKYLQMAKEEKNESVFTICERYLP